MEYRHVLVAGQVLADQFRIESVLGAGGFGITYLARDIGLDSTVVVKEYFPSQIAVREATMTVHPRSRSEEALFDWGRERFVREAQILDACEHPHIVRVRRVFEANNTAYMALNFVDGPSLDAWLKKLDRTPTQAEMDALAGPLLDALDYIHTRPNQILHRDVAPDNIIMHAKRGPILIDFGAARVDTAGRSHSKAGTVKDGYSPKEQHSQRGDLQGPWTDIYSTGATFWRAITGKRPPDCLERDLDAAVMPSLADMAAELAPLGYRPSFLAGVDAAMAMRPQDRPQSVAAWRAMLVEVPPSLPERPPRQPDPLPDPPLDPRSEARTVRHQDLPRPAPPAPAVGRGLIFAVLAVALAGSAAYGYDRVVKQRVIREAVVRGEQPLPPPQTQPGPVPLPPPSPPKSETLPPPTPAPSQPAASPRQAATEPSQQPVPAPAQPAPAQQVATVQTQPAPVGRTNSAQAEQAAAECDRLARPPTDEAKGVAQADIDAAAAQLQCRAAVTAFPREPRFATALGRAFAKADDLVTATKWYDTAAQAGEPQAMNYLGTFYERGVVVPLDLDKARTWYEKAAALGVSAAATNVGMLYLNGRGVTRDPGQARAWYEHAAEKGNAVAQSSLGLIYRDGTGVPVDLAKARAFFELATAKQHSFSMTNLAQMLQRGQGGAADHPRSMMLYEQAAALGNGAAARLLGQAFLHGQGVTRDQPKGRKWLERGSELADAEAEHTLGVVYRDGLGVTADLTAARVWFQKAAAKDHAPAAAEIGNFFNLGQGGLSHDHGKAREWYERAVAKELPSAMRTLAALLDRGEGGPAAPARSASLLLDAARRGDARAQSLLTGDLVNWTPATRRALQDQLRAAGILTGAAGEAWDEASRSAARRHFAAK